MAAQRKYWYKISVDAVRGWTAFLTLAVLAVAGVYGYRLLTRHLLDRQVVMVMDEADELIIRLRNEKNLSLHQEKYDGALASLGEARDLHGRGELARALLSAQRSRSLLVSIVDSLRHRNPAGEAQFVSARGRVRSREALLSKLWGYDSDVMSRTIDTHVRRLRSKLGSASSWLSTVRGVGYRIEDPAAR